VTYVAVEATAPNGHGRSSTDDTQAGAGGDLAVRLTESARSLHQQRDPDETMRAVVAAAVALIPGAEEGSISVVVGRQRLHSEASTSEFANTLDQLQEATGEGPCLDAVYEQHTVRVDDTSSERRWPRFSAQACEAGAGSMLALQLFVEGDNLGALNLYARQVDAFDEESEHVGQLFASHAAMAYSTARRQSQLLRAVTTREVIGQAQGILMERHRITPDRAFAMLVNASQRANVKLRDIADTLVRTGVVLDEAES
jgi:transcriptional regulator with GAF, ATPase, and Fis domain